ncbi:MAG: hypothetical protein HYS05_11710 [Acidobacteria bacterium]|nr:hypothetical protein [Acidobacteriota bacterium]
MHEREFFDERPETRQQTMTCPFCRRQAEYGVRWMRRTKKAQLPRGADERDRAMFPKLRNYLVRLDDAITCGTCRRRFEIPSHQSIMFLE